MYKTKCLLSTAKQIVIEEKVLKHQRLENNTDMLLVDELAKHGFDMYDKFWFNYDMYGNIIIFAWKATWLDRLLTRLSYWWNKIETPKGSI